MFETAPPPGWPQPRLLSPFHMAEVVAIGTLRDLAQFADQQITSSATHAKTFKLSISLAATCYLLDVACLDLAHVVLGDTRKRVLGALLRVCCGMVPVLLDSSVCALQDVALVLCVQPASSSVVSQVEALLKRADACTRLFSVCQQQSEWMPSNHVPASNFELWLAQQLSAN